LVKSVRLGRDDQLSIPHTSEALKQKNPAPLPARPGSPL
jgi:hypothetical protein